MKNKEEKKEEKQEQPPYSPGYGESVTIGDLAIHSDCIAADKLADILLVLLQRDEVKNYFDTYNSKENKQEYLG